jgi:hypothetical protein
VAKRDKLKTETNILSDWSGVIDRIAKASADRQNERVKALKKSVKKLDPASMNNEKLITTFELSCSFNSHDPREVELYKKGAGKLRKEILRRMVDDPKPA